MKSKLLIVMLLLSLGIFGQVSLDTLSKKERKLLKKQLFLQNNDAFKSVGLVFSQSQFQDTRMSPLIFDALGAAVDLKYLRYGSRFMKQRQLRLHYYGAKANELPDQLMHLAKLEYSYQLLQKIPFPQGKLYLGAAVNNLLNARLYKPLGNNAFAADNSLSLQACFFWILDKKMFSRESILAVQGGFNLLNLSLRFPYYAYSGIEPQALSFTNYHRIFVELQYAPRLKNSKENHYNISYIFEAYSFSSANDQKRIATYFNGIKFAYWLKTK